METEFKKYVERFDFNNPMIYLKYYHTLRVVKYSEIIAKSLDLANKDIVLAKTIGLLHDFGRFEQATKYGTFSDINSVDHATLGLKILFDDNEISKYKINPDNYELIKVAIANHNKYEIEENLTEIELMFAKIIRDADKIDIFNVYIIKNINFGDNIQTITSKVQESFNNKQCVNHVDMVTDYDVIIATLAMIYDLNFIESFKILRKEKIFEKLQKIYSAPILKKYFDQAITYIRKKSENNDGY